MTNLNSVVLIDDDNIFNLINKKIIEKGNFARNVMSFVNPQKALNKLKEFSQNGEFPDVIFLDINMPVMDGWEFLDEIEKLVEVFKKCRVYILSSSIDPNDIEKSQSYKIVRDFISKPLNEEILNNILTQALQSIN